MSSRPLPGCKRWAEWDIKTCRTERCVDSDLQFRLFSAVIATAKIGLRARNPDARSATNTQGLLSEGSKQGLEEFPHQWLQKTLRRTVSVQDSRPLREKSPHTSEDVAGESRAWPSEVQGQVSGVGPSMVPSAVRLSTPWILPVLEWHEGTTRPLWLNCFWSFGGS